MLESKIKTRKTHILMHEYRIELTMSQSKSTTKQTLSQSSNFYNHNVLFHITIPVFLMLFLQLFRSLEGKEVVVEMRNDLIVSGILSSADQFYK